MTTSTKKSDSDGLFPKTGYITEAELGKRLRLRDTKNLRITLIELGVDHVEICRKFLFSLESFDKLFFD